MVISGNLIRTWCSIAAVVVTATAGDIMIAHAMKELDLDAIMEEHGLGATILAVIKRPTLILGIVGMAFSFFSLLFALSGADLSLIAPATASLTFVTTALSAKFFLKEQVNLRRWIAVICMCIGAAFVAH